MIKIAKQSSIIPGSPLRLELRKHPRFIPCTSDESLKDPRTFRLPDLSFFILPPILSPLPSHDIDSDGSTFEDVPGPSKECKIGALWPGEKHSEASSFLKDLAEDLFGAQDDRDRSDEVEQKASGIK